MAHQRIRNQSRNHFLHLIALLQPHAVLSNVGRLGYSGTVQNETDIPVLIVGAGISGLASAWFLHRQGIAVRVLEGADRPGGVIASDRGDGYLVERGPNSTLQRPGRDEDALGRLIAGAGIEGRVVEAAAAAKKRFVVRDGRLVALPGSPPAILATALFSWRAKLRLLGEPFVGRAGAEESIAQFVERRLGREFLDYAVEPFVSGVYAGDPAALSVRAAVPRIHALEDRHGSLIRGAIAMGKAAERAGMPSGRLISFDTGMAALPETIAGQLPEGAIRTGCRVAALHPDDDGWRVHWEGATDSGTMRAGRVVLAVPAAVAAGLLSPLSAEAAGILDAIPYAPIVSTAMAYGRNRVDHPLDGFGFLIPRREGYRILGGLFSSTLFPGRAPDEKALITAFVGGTTDPAALDMDSDGINGLVHGELARVLGIGESASVIGHSRYRRAIPQYTLGHLERMERLDGLLAGFPGLHLRANWRDGISVADCVRNGELTADAITTLVTG